MQPRENQNNGVPRADTYAKYYFSNLASIEYYMQHQLIRK
jgi:hypothetical protein